MKKSILKRAISAVICGLMVLSLAACGVSVKSKYTEAVSLYEAGQYDEAEKIFTEISDKKDCSDYIENCKTMKMVSLLTADKWKSLMENKALEFNENGEGIFHNENKEQKFTYTTEDKTITFVMTDDTTTDSFTYSEENNIKKLTLSDGNSVYVSSNDFDNAIITMKKTTLGDMTIEGLYIDNAYRDTDNESLRLLYVVYSVSAKNDNFKIDSKSMGLLIGESHTYPIARIPNETKYMSNYHYSDYLKDVYVGDTAKFVETFEVPIGEFESSKRIVLWKPQISKTEKFLMTTDDIVFADGKEEVAKLADPDGYAEEIEKRADADEATTNRVKKAINGYEWSFEISVQGSYKLEFITPNKFELNIKMGFSVKLPTIYGTYTVKNGYVNCVYDSGFIVEIPYSWKDNGDIDLEVATAFSVKE